MEQRQIGCSRVGRQRRPDVLRRLENLELEVRFWITAPADGVPVRRISASTSLRLTSELEGLIGRLGTYPEPRRRRFTERTDAIRADLDHAWDIAEGVVPPPRRAPRRRSIVDRLREEAGVDAGARWWDPESGRSRRVVSGGLPSTGRRR